MPVSRRPDPDVSSSHGMAPHPDFISAWRTLPMPVDPDPFAPSDDVMSLDPDVKSARSGRPGDDDRSRRRGRRAADLYFLDDNWARSVGYDNAAGTNNHYKKTNAAQQIFHTVHNLLLPSTQKLIQSSPAITKNNLVRANHILLLLI